MASWFSSIEDAKAATDAAFKGVAAGLFITAATSLVATLSIIYDKPIIGIDAWAFVDAIFFAFASWRIYKMSRTWAVLALLTYIYEVGWQIAKRFDSSEHNFSVVIAYLSLIYILAFVNAVRGTFAYHRLRGAPPGGEAARGVEALTGSTLNRTGSQPVRVDGQSAFCTQCGGQILSH